MESNILNKLSNDIGIAPEFVIRENWEMRILDKLAQTNIGQSLVFKGGTALRLAYNSPRFSEDLDFDITQKINFYDFKKIVNRIVASDSNLKLKDLAKKYYTYLAQINIWDESLSRNFFIKIEVSTRTIRPRNYGEPKLIISPVNSLQVLMNVARLSEIKKEKLIAVKTRKQPRDLFDLWFIAQLNREPWKCPEYKYSREEVKMELNKYLPRKYQGVIKELVYEK